jgi:4-diphosphocytidyl-2-C-methyl-D-erythritol kinase
MFKAGLALRAPAKINLHLSVTGRRSDGYHLLDTLLAKLDLADQLLILPGGNGLRLTLENSDLPEDEGNLAYRAARAFLEASGVGGGFSLRLTKHIPVAAGLGGGSSDAAAVLSGLNQLYGRPLSGEALSTLGLSLGADVPFFLYPHQAAWASGVGEVLRPARLPARLRLLLVNPGWPLSTEWVFKNYKLKLTTSRQNHIFSGLYESSFTKDGPWHNDLEQVVLPVYPEVATIKESLISFGAEAAMMTGSGPTVFGIFSDDRILERARQYLDKAGQGRWLVIPTFTLGGD